MGVPKQGLFLRNPRGTAVRFRVGITHSDILSGTIGAWYGAYTGLARSTEHPSKGFRPTFHVKLEEDPGSVSVRVSYHRVDWRPPV